MLEEIPFLAESGYIDHRMDILILNSDIYNLKLTLKKKKKLSFNWDIKKLI